MNLLGKIAVAVGAGALAAGMTLGGTAHAAVLDPPPGGTTQLQSGDAGYYVDHWNNWHIRDAHAVFTITPAMMSLNGTSQTPGATGVELCDDDTGFTAQLGLTYLGGKFEILGNDGYLVTDTSDPCVMSGTLSTQGDPAVQLAGDDGIQAGVQNIALSGEPDTWVYPGNEADPAVDRTALAVGDKVALDLYYNPTAGKHGRHSLQFTTSIYDSQGGFIKEIQYSTQVRTTNFYEAGIGVFNSNAPQLTSPAVNPLVTFTDATFSNYNKTVNTRLAGGWDLVQAVTVNGASQVVLQPSAVSGKTTTFSIGEGSVLPQPLP